MKKYVKKHIRCEGCRTFIYTVRAKLCAQCRHLKTKWHVDPVDIQRIKFLQGGRCKICDTLPDKKALSVDHNHYTGKIRGLLCQSCNIGIGYLRTPELLTSAIQYLESKPHEVRLLCIDAKRDPISEADKTTTKWIFDDSTIPTLRGKARILSEKLGIKEEAAVSRLRRYHNM